VISVAPRFADLSEQASLCALASVEAGEDADAAGEAFVPLWSWCEARAGDEPAKRLITGFDLSRAESALFALLFAAETSEQVARAVSEALARIGGASATGIPLWLACRAIPHLDAGALAGSGPLMRFEVVHTFPEQTPRIETRMTLAPTIVDRVLGHSVLDPMLTARIMPLPDLHPAATRDTGAATVGTEPEASLVEALSQVLGAHGPIGLPPLAVAADTPVLAVAAALRTLGLDPWRMMVSDVPADPENCERLAVRWSREAALDAAALIVHGSGQDAYLGVTASTASFLDRVVGHVLLVGLRAPATLNRGVEALPPDPDSPTTMRHRWAVALGPNRAERIGHGLNRVAAHFRLEEGARELAVSVAGSEIDRAPDATTAAAALWHAAARVATPEPLPGARIIEPGYTWDDLVLPVQTASALRRVELHVRHAARVFDDWGFAARIGGRGSWRGRGVAVLFAGPSGTGKTMAAEVLAASLDLRVMVIDLSQVISKYVGETSKNIAAVFVEAERSGAVMVWNEGDAIWGARGAVGNAVDRHVNAEVGDLLQRIEEFSGFTVVTTNMRQSIDPAFLRRFRFIIDFPMPSEAERLRLWRSAFPAETPVETLDWTSLAALPMTGGSIRNVALGAAFLAAEAGSPISREMIESEFGEEMRKQNLPVPRLAWAES
jgi:hypothetical protein